MSNVHADILGGIPLINCPFNSSSLKFFNSTSSSRLFAPAISFTYLASVCLCIYFTLSLIWYHHKVRIFNRSINHPSVLNTEYAIFFLTLGLSFLIDFARYSTGLPYATYHHNDDSSTFIKYDRFLDRHDMPFLVSLPVIEAWLLMASVSFRCLASLFLSLGLYQQILYRSSNIVLTREPPTHRNLPITNRNSQSSASSLPQSPVLNVRSPRLTPEPGSPVQQLRSGRFSFANEPQADSEENLDRQSETVQEEVERRSSQEDDPTLTIEPRRPSTNSFMRRTRSVSSTLLGYHPIPGFGRDFSNRSLDYYRNILNNQRTAPRASYGSVGGGEDDEEALARLLEEDEEALDEDEMTAWQAFVQVLKERFLVLSSPALLWNLCLNVFVSWPTVIGLAFSIRIITWYIVIDRLAFVDPEQISYNEHITILKTNAVANTVASTIQFLVCVALTVQIMITTASPTTSAPSSPFRPVARRRRQHGPAIFTRILFFVSILPLSVWMFEASIFNKWIVLSLTDFKEGDVNVAQGNFQNLMCVVPPWWWIGQGTNATTIAPSFAVMDNDSSPLPRELRGWASWTDLYQWIGAVGLILLHGVVTKEYKRNMQEWIWLTVNEVRNTFDFRRP